MPWVLSDFYQKDNTLMSAELAFIFSNVFDTLFDYDEKYDELDFKKDITAQIITDCINGKSKGLRDIWYRCYPVLMNHYHLYTMYNEDQLLNAIEYDNDYAFIPNAFVTQKMLKEHTFIKPIEQDYKFKQLTEQNDRDHFTLKYPVKYANGLNFDDYAERGLVNINRLTDFLNIMDVKWTIHYINHNDGDLEIIIKRLFNEPDFANLFNQIIGDCKKKQLTDIIVANNDKLKAFELIPYANVLEDYSRFEFTDVDISCAVTAEMIKRIKESTDVERDIKRLKKSFDYCLKYPHSREYLEYVLQHGTVKQVVSACFVNDPPTALWILKQREDCVIEYLCELVNRKIINRDNFNELTEGIIDNPIRFDIGFAWVRTYKEEPPLLFYPNPNYREESTKNQKNPRKQWQTGVTIADVWAQYVNESTTPMEMTSMKYYDYMVKSNGVKRNPNQTIMYSYFSNSNENKLIFCRSNIELLDPAVPRYYIPVEFRKLKQYLHEDLLTTDICMFAQLTKNDWEKVAGGREDIDIVAFNDMKNVYRERTPLRKVIEYLIDNIEIEFDGVKCAKASDF